MEKGEYSAGYKPSRYAGPVEAAARQQWEGKPALWRAELRQGTVCFLVKVIDVRVNFGRVDLLLETNVGDTIWASEATLELDIERGLGSIKERQKAVGSTK